MYNEKIGLDITQHNEVAYNYSNIKAHHIHKKSVQYKAKVRYKKHNK